MSTEALYYQALSTNASLTNIVGDRIYPIKLPQDVVYPAMFYETEAEIEERISIGDVKGVYSFANTFYAPSYADILKITEAFREISKDKQMNIAGYVDLDFVTEKNVYARALVVTALGQI